MFQSAPEGSEQHPESGTTERRCRQKITPNLWFENRAEEAVDFYISVFENSRILAITRYGKAGAEASGMPEGSIMTVTFELNEQEFTALNGGPAFKFNKAVSLTVHCENQKEVDYYWEKRSEGGDENAQICG